MKNLTKTLNSISYGTVRNNSAVAFYNEIHKLLYSNSVLKLRDNLMIDLCFEINNKIQASLKRSSISNEN